MVEQDPVKSKSAETFRRNPFEGMPNSYDKPQIDELTSVVGRSFAQGTPDAPQQELNRRQVQSNMAAYLSAIVKKQDEDVGHFYKSSFDTISNAVATAQQQELHESKLAAAQSSLIKDQSSLQLDQSKKKGLDLKNQQAELDMEMAKARAVKDGIAPLVQDPNELGRSFSRGTPDAPTQYPSNGKAIESYLLRNNSNVAEGTLGAISTALGKSLGQNDLLGRSGERRSEMASFVQQELIQGYKDFESEKDLRYGPLSGSPLGLVTDIAGGVLDLVSFGSKLGTEIFGGTPSATEKLEMMANISSRVSPIVNAELRDLLGQDRMEQSVQRFLGNRGMSYASKGLKTGDIEQADARLVIGMDIQDILRNNVVTQEAFGTDVTTGIGPAFRIFQNNVALNYKLNEAQTEEEAIAISQQMRELDSAIQDQINQWMAQMGGKEDLTIEEKVRMASKKFNDMMLAASNAIHERYNKQLGSMVLDKDSDARQIDERIVSAGFNDQLAKFSNRINSSIPANVDKVLQSKLGPEKFARYKSIQSLEIEGKYTPRPVNTPGATAPTNYKQTRTLKEGDIDRVLQIADNMPPESVEKLSEMGHQRLLGNPLYAELWNISVDEESFAKLYKLISTSAGRKDVDKILDLMAQRKK